MAPRARSALTLVCLLACGWYVVFVARAAFRIHDGRWVYSLFDDAMISMRYARNLADGYGLRWNPGEPAVEGYSNLLWTLVMAGLHLLRLPDRWAALPVAITGITILAASIWMAARIADALVEERGSRAGVYAAVLTATCYPVVFWTLRGMEVGLLALFTLLLVRATVDRGMRVSRRYAVAVLATAGLVLTRDDGIVLVIAVCAVGVFAADRETRRVVSASVTALAVSTVAHLLWRRSYYGGWVPNTYYLKLTGAPLVDRLSRGASTLFGVVTRQAGPILVVAACELWRRFETRALILIAPFAATCAYSLYVGGDAWEFLNFANRYVSPSLPALCVAAGVYLARLDADAVVPRAGAIALAVMMLAGAAWDAVEKVRLPYLHAHIARMGGRDDGRRCCRPVRRASAAPATQRRRVDGARISRGAQRGAATRAVGAVELSDVRQRSRRDPGGLCGARIDVAAGVNRGHPCRLWTLLCEKAFNRSSWQERSPHRDAAVRRLLSRARQDGPSVQLRDASGRCRDVV